MTTRVRISVVEGGVSAVTYVEDVIGGEHEFLAGDSIPPEFLETFEPVEGLFDGISRAIAEEPHILEIDYHPVLGYPLEFLVVWCSGCLDAGYSETVSDLEPAPSPASGMSPGMSPKGGETWSTR